MAEGKDTHTAEQEKDADKWLPWWKRLWGWTQVGKKSGWDQLQLLVVPLALAVIGILFSWQQDARQQAIESERALEDQRAQDAALQAYLDQMSTLMLNRNLLESEQGDTIYTLAQARTSTVITRLDADHNRNVTRFLSDSGLPGAPVGESSMSLFRRIDLTGAILYYADLSGTTGTTNK